MTKLTAESLGLLVPRKKSAEECFQASSVSRVALTHPDVVVVERPERSSRPYEELTLEKMQYMLCIVY